MVIKRRIVISLLLLLVCVTAAEGLWGRRGSSRSGSSRSSSGSRKSPAPAPAPAPQSSSVEISGEVSVKVGRFEITGGGTIKITTTQRSVSRVLYELHVDISPCQFSLYDTNRNWEITNDEMHSVFKANIADNLFRDLDTSGDGVITMKEFLLAPKIIAGVGCDPNGLPVDFHLMDLDATDDGDDD